MKLFTKATKFFNNSYYRKVISSSFIITFLLLILTFGTIALLNNSKGWFSNNIETTTTGMSVRTNAYGLEVNLYKTDGTQIVWESDELFDDLTIPGKSTIFIMEIINKSQQPVSISDIRLMAPLEGEEVPVKVSTTYTSASSLEFDESVTYFTRTGTEGSYVYTKVQSPTSANMASYYVQTSYTNYWFSSQLYFDMIYSGRTKPVNTITSSSFSKEGIQLNPNETSSSQPGEFIFVSENTSGDYALTKDSAINTNKTYYTRSGTEGSYTYTKVDSPSAGSLSSYYEPVIRLEEAGTSNNSDRYYIAIRVLFKNLDSNQNVYVNFGENRNTDGTLPILKRKVFISFDLN